MKTIIKMKLELEYFSPYFKIIRPEKLLLFQLSQNSSQNASKQTHPPHVNRCIYSTDTYPSIYIYNRPRNIRHRDKNEEKEKKGKERGKKRRKEWNERGLIYVSASSRFVPRSGDVERVHVIRQLFIILLAYSRRETRQFMRVLIFSLSFYFLFLLPPFSPSFSSTGIAKILDGEAE